MSVENKYNFYYDEEIDKLISQLEVGFDRDFPVTSVACSNTSRKSLDGKYSRIRKEKCREREVKEQLAIKKNNKRRSMQRRCDRYDLIGESLMGAIDNKHGVQLTSRETTSVAQRAMYTGDHDMSDATIKETGWDLARLVERPNLVLSMQWTSAMSGHVSNLAIPSGLLSVELVRIPFNAFQYWRGDVVLKMQVAGSPMVQGIICMTFVPLVDMAALNSMVWDISSLTINPTVYLFANTNTPAELRIPYNHVQSYLRTDFGDPGSITIDQNLGYVVIWVLEPLKALTLTSVTVSLFSVLENSEFKVPRISSDVTELRAEAGFFTSAISSIMDVGSSLIGPVVEDLGAIGKSKMKSVVKKGAKQLTEELSTKTLPSNFIGDAIDMVGDTLGSMLGFLGLDNPTIPTEENRAIVKSNGSMNYSVGPEFIEKLSMLPSAISIVTPETFATISDEMDVNYLYRRYSYFGSFTFTSTAAPSTVVYSLPLSPFPTFTDGTMATLVGAGTVIQDAVWFPLLSYLGLPYRYWTGGLKYKFVVSCSSLQTCKLYASFNYGRFTAPTNLLDAASQYGHAIEISQGSNEFEFAVPYIAPQPYLEVSTGSTNGENCMGMLNIVVLNSLVSPTSVVDSITVAMFICGSDDFSYEFISGNNPAMVVYRDGGSLVPSVLNEAANPMSMIPTGEYLYVNRGESGSYKPCPYCGFILHECICIVGESLLSAQTIAPTNVDTTITDMAMGDENEDDDQIAPPQVDAVVDDHFGIVGISLRNLAKKYQLVGQIALGNVDTAYSPGWSVGKLRLPYDLFCAPIYAATPPVTTPLPKTAPAGLLAWMAAMYRQFKGGLRFKIVLNTSGVGETPDPFPFISAYVTFKPGPDSSVNSDIINSDVLGQIPYGIGTNAAISLSGHVYPAFSTPVLSVLNGNVSNVLEFEIPYNSKYLSTLVPTSSQSDYTNSLFRYSGLGSLYIVASSPSTQRIIAQVYVAFADESRFGTLYRVPLAYAPAAYTLSGTSLTPVSNIGAGTYYVPAMLVGESKVEFPAGMTENLPSLDFGIDEAIDQVTDLTSKIELEKQQPGPPLVVPSNQQTGTGRTNVRRRGKQNYNAWFRSRVRNFVRSNGGVTPVELGKFLRYVSNRNPDQAKFGGGDFRRSARMAGLRLGRNGNWYVNPWPQRGIRNRRPIQKDSSGTTV